MMHTLKQHKTLEEKMKISFKLPLKYSEVGERAKIPVKLISTFTIPGRVSTMHIAVAKLSM